MRRVYDDSNRRRVTVRQAVEDYLLHLKARFKPKTVQRAEYCLRKLLSYCDISNIRTMGQLDRRNIILFANNMRSAGYRDETVWAITSTCKAFLNWCVEEGYLDESPVRPRDLPAKPKPKPQPLSEEELHKVLNACNDPGWLGERNYAMVYTLAATGMRRGELLQMRVGDLQRGYTVVLGKGDKQRRIGLPPNVVDVVQRYLRRLKRERGVLLEEEDPVWWSRYLTPMTDESVRRMLDKIGKRVGIDLYAHRLRDTFATLSIAKGVPTETVRTVMGHEDARSINAYARLSQRQVDDTMWRMNPLAGVDFPNRRRSRRIRREEDEEEEED